MIFLLCQTRITIEELFDKGGGVDYGRAGLRVAREDSGLIGLEVHAFTQIIVS